MWIYFKWIKSIVCIQILGLHCAAGYVTNMVRVCTLHILTTFDWFSTSLLFLHYVFLYNAFNVLLNLIVHIVTVYTDNYILKAECRIKACAYVYNANSVNSRRKHVKQWYVYLTCFASACSVHHFISRWTKIKIWWKSYKSLMTKRPHAHLNMTWFQQKDHTRT